MSGEGTTVCVTGASGYIASWIIKLLLERGYTVRATLRDPNDPRKTGHLFALAGAKEKLHLFKADLADEGSWDPVVHGCQVVFHVASPVLFQSSDPQAEIIDPAVKGTLSILKACAEAPSIRRVVLTSSLATALFSSRPLASGDVIDETCFSDPQFCEESQAEVIDPAVKGTLNVLRDCTKAPSVKRVVLTSSIAAVVITGKPLASDCIVDETWFSDPQFCKDSQFLARF